MKRFKQFSTQTDFERISKSVENKVKKLKIEIEDKVIAAEFGQVAKDLSKSTKFTVFSTSEYKSRHRYLAVEMIVDASTQEISAAISTIKKHLKSKDVKVVSVLPDPRNTVTPMVIVELDLSASVSQMTNSIIEKILS
jgi:hypothetical protein